VLVAVIAAGLAAYLALGNAFNQPAPDQPVQVVQAQHDQVLIAKTDIGIGERLGATNLEWQDWPQTMVQPGYITSSSTPRAIDDMHNTVARFELFKGEPILQAKLVHSDQGYLSAVLDKGMRGVSISVAAEAASGGFIVPNDHVDVILTRQAPGGQQTSETLLANVRVLAINTRLGETGKTGGPDDSSAPPEGADGPKSQVFSGGAIATLELDPVQAETVINATTLGKLSLALRSIVDFAQVSDDDAKLKRNAPIRLIRYGQEASVMAGQAAGSSSGDNATVNPASFRPPVPTAPATTPMTTPAPAPAKPVGVPPQSTPE
jgi:pilus assembly protein CpaB